MNFADSALASAASPFYAVFRWNGARTRRTVFRNYAERTEAEEGAAALRKHGIKADVIAVGDAPSRKT